MDQLSIEAAVSHINHQFEASSNHLILTFPELGQRQNQWDELTMQMDQHQHMIWDIMSHDEESLLGMLNEEILPEISSMEPDALLIHIFGIESQFISIILDVEDTPALTTKSTFSQILEAIPCNLIIWVHQGLLDQIRPSLETLPEPFALSSTGEAEEIEKDFEAPEKILEAASEEELSEEEKIAEIAEAYHQKGRYESFQENWASALHSYREAMLWRSKSEDPRIAKTYVNIGGIYQQYGKLQDASQYYEMALEKEENEETTSAITAAKAQLGRLHLLWQELGPAAEYLQEASTAYEERERYEQLGQVQEDLAQLAIHTRAFDKATKCQEKAVAAYQEAEITGIGSSQMRLASLYEQIGKLEEAIDEYKDAADSFEAEQKITEMARCYQRIGLIHQGQRRWEDSLESFKRALEQATEIQDEFLVHALEDSLEQLSAKVKSGKKKGLFGGLFGK